jgi:hypothetical protein
MHNLLRQGALALFVGLLLLWAPQPRAAELGAKEFLVKLYANYTGKAKGIDYTSPANVKRYLTPELGSLLLKKMETDAKKADEVPDLDGDPFVAAQEWVLTELVITVTENGPGHATGVVSFKNRGQPKTITLDLTKTKAGWRIDDIHWPGDEGSLRKLISGGTST